MGMESKYIWMDGQMVEYEKATVHFLAPALHFGLGVFEGIRCYKTARGPAVFRLQEHIERLINSAKIIGLDQFAFSHADLCQAVKDTIKANSFEACYIRPLVYHTAKGPSLSLLGGEDHIGIAVWQWAAFITEEARHQGIRACVSSFTRSHPNANMTKAKATGNYVNSVLARTEADRLGFDEAILLDPQGFVAECTGENLFLVRKGNIYTPNTVDILEGITRDTLMVLARELGYTVIEQPVSRDQLYVSDEVFMCGTAAELLSLTEIDGRKIGCGCMGPVAAQLQGEFHALVTGQSGKHPGWLDYVESGRQ